MRKPWTRLPDSQWIAIKAAYETDPSRPSPEQLAKIYGVDRTTIDKRARAQSWTRKDSLAIATIKALENENDAIVAKTTANVAAQLTQHLSDSLQPWIEKQKTQHLKNQIRRSKLALKQVDTFLAPGPVLSPKDSQFVAKTAETWDTIARRNLGLNDMSPVAGSLNLQILTNHSAVQISPRE